MRRYINIQPRKSYLWTALTFGLTSVFFTPSATAQWTSGSGITYTNDDVGINISAPVAPLHLYSTDNPTVFRIQSAPSGDAFGSGQIEFWSNAQSSGNLWRPAAIASTDFGGFHGGLKFSVGGIGSSNATTLTEIMRVVPAGLGIHKVSATEALDVEGNVRFSGTLKPNNNPGASNEALISQGSASPPIWSNLNNIAWRILGNGGTNPANHFLGTTDGVDLVLRTSNTERARLLAAGDFRVGDAGSGTALPVAQYPILRNGLLFSGGAPQGNYDGDNSDPLWMARFNVGTDFSELRMMLGDNADVNNQDYFNIGGIDAGVFQSRVNVNSNGGVGVGTLLAGNRLQAINRVDIWRNNRAHATSTTVDPGAVPSNTSGLRLVDFAGITPLQAQAPNGLVLSVDAQGDVIITRDCCNPEARVDPNLGPDATAVEMFEAELSTLRLELATLHARLNEIETVPNKLLPQIPTGVMFCQNDPNPFSDRTTVQYELPEGITAAALEVYGVDGVPVRQVQLPVIGTGEIEVSMGGLPSGSYFYTLIVDGYPMPLKKMSLQQ